MRFTKLALVLLLATCAWSAAAPASAAPRPLPPLTPAKHDALSRALEQGRLTESQYALERARSLFTLGRVRAEFGHVARANPHAATFILRDLLARTRFLSGSEHAEAKAILSRPDGAPTFLGEPTWDFDAIPTSFCEGGGRPLCFHWDNNPTNRDSPPTADTNPANGIPDQIDRTIEVLDNVWDTETAGLGYRDPLDDSATTLNDGGGPQLDIYIADIGSIGLFGYCTSDDPHAYEFSAPWAVSAYCVLDDDYRQAQYGIGQTSLEYLQVTAAHEFFHAVQFAYDWFEDYALMEGSAMWMEGQVYPAVIDRINYLGRSALARPGVPLDTGAGGFEYGAWLFWRFLTEKVFSGDPTIIREIWERADGGPSPAFGDLYSFQAVRRALAAHGLDFRSTFAQFGWTNDLRDYEEADSRLPGRSARSDVQLRPLPAFDGLGGAETRPPLHALLPLPPAGGRLGGEAAPRRRPSRAGDEPRGDCDRLCEGRPEGDPPDRARRPRRRPRHRRSSGARRSGRSTSSSRTGASASTARRRTSRTPSTPAAGSRRTTAARTASAPAWAKRR